MLKSQHHAKGVEDVVLTLAGAIIWKKDKDPLVVKEYDGDIANVLWVWFGGKRYAFVYNHENGVIDMRRNSMRGKSIESFGAKNGSPRRIRLVFQKLTRGKKG